MVDKISQSIEKAFNKSRDADGPGSYEGVVRLAIRMATEGTLSEAKMQEVASSWLGITPPVSDLPGVMTALKKIAFGQ